ncbi:MAG: cob(I)yrinic acid a,c-diamide adenosyltransferase [Lachnospiraceae bacterium]|nr:cob(I)yrinic acid a,c-diamide adenosyltransferase [Lachnospiraceae bacterium]
MEKGLIHVYHGDGKGKTTAAVGLAIRAAGAQKQVIFAQFLKGSPTGELQSFEKLSNIRVLRSKEDLGFFKNMTPEEKEKSEKIHTEIMQQIFSILEKESIDLVILDEITYPYEYDNVDRKLVEKLILQKPDNIELVITGRNPASLFLERADYITEMKKIRHPFDKNIPARCGVEY